MKKREYFEKLAREYESSDQGKREFCARQGVRESTLDYWRAKLKRAPVFLPIASEAVELELSSGAKLRVKAHQLKLVLDALR